MGQEVKPEKYTAEDLAAFAQAIPAGNEVVPTPRCKRHSRFKAVRKPRNGCVRCMAMFTYAKAMGIRETRRRKLPLKENV